jgi:CRP-like cAMP-binding protein/predicted MFS family arabinose efflux permease
MSSGRARYRDALAQRDFRLLVTSFIADQLGSWAYNVVLIAYIYDRTHSVTYLTVAGFIRFTPGLVLSPYAGVLADRFERATVMLCGVLVAFATMTGLTLVVAYDGPLPLLLLFTFLTACACTVNRPAASALTPDLVGEKDLAAANALMAVLENLMVVLGPALGGLFLLTGSAVIGFEANALSFLVSGLAIVMIRTRSYGEISDAATSPVEVLTSGARALIAQPVALTLVLFCCLDTVVFGVSTVLYIPMSVRFGTGSEGYSYLLIAAALGGVLVGGLVNRLSASGRLAPIILGGMLLLALPYAATVLTHSRYVGFVLQLIAGAGMVMVDVLAVTALQRDVPKASLGRVFGVFESLIPGSVMVGSLITAPLLNVFGLTTTLLIIGFGISGVAVLALPPVLRADRSLAAVAAQLRPRVALLEVLDLFASASRPALERLASAVEVVELPADTVVMREGEAADALWVLVTGEVAVSALGEGARAHRLRTMGPRSYLGEIGLLRNLPRTATVRTLEPSVLWRIPGEDFLAAAEVGSISSSMQTGVASRLARSHPRLALEPTPVPALAH